MIVRIRSADGTVRIDIQPTDTIQILCQKLPEHLRNSKLSTQPNSLSTLDLQLTLSQCGIKHGDLLFATANAKPEVKQQSPSITAGMTKLDIELEKDPGLIKRSTDTTFCRHGPKAMCDYCMPLEPYDPKYLQTKKIKHMSFYSFLRQRLHQKSAVMLEEPVFKVMPKCPSGHEPYPKSMCAKCQPSAIVLQPQVFRMVDHVEFETPQIVDKFISFWRQSGLQRFGYLYGRFEKHSDVPLGIKAVVSAIYEPPQIPAVDGIELLPEDDTILGEISAKFGLERVGMIYTDLTDDGKGTGKVLCKRHLDSFFVSSAECIFIARKQLEIPFKTLKSSSGQFGSRFVTVIVSGDTNGDIHLNAYQLSNTGMSMVRDEIVDASSDAQLMRVRESTSQQYVPDVFYRFKNEYNVQVQEKANPTFPVDYLLVSLSEGFPHVANPLFKSFDFSIENRRGFEVGASLESLASKIKNSTDLAKTMSDFHLLLFLSHLDFIEKKDLNTILELVKTSPADFSAQISALDSWQTLNAVVQSSGSSSKPSSSTPVAANWTCSHCTFINSSSGDCEMCGLPK